MVKRGRKGTAKTHRRRRHRGGGALDNAAVYNPEGTPMAESQYYTISAGGGRRKHKSRRHGSSKRMSRKDKKGGEGVLATAAVPFGLLALQRYFKGSRTSKQGVAKIGRTFKRTFRR